MSIKGGVSIPIFECIFSEAGSFTGFERDFDEKLYMVLPNLYAVCIKDKSYKPHRIIGGIFVKTSYTHKDKEFIDSLNAVVETSSNLGKYLGSNFTFLPARLGVEGSSPLSENKMQEIMQTQYLRFSQSGTA